MNVHFASQQDLSHLQFSSVAQLCPTLCNPKNHSMPGLPVHHQLPEFTQALNLAVRVTPLLLLLFKAELT